MGMNIGLLSVEQVTLFKKNQKTNLLPLEAAL